ncbi:hypothetical protein Hanom_Chr12g01128851 [Helianthus anomalus]
MHSNNQSQIFNPYYRSICDACSLHHSVCGPYYNLIMNRSLQFFLFFLNQ